MLPVFTSMITNKLYHNISRRYMAEILQIQRKPYSINQSIKQTIKQYNALYSVKTFIEIPLVTLSIFYNSFHRYT